MVPSAKKKIALGVGVVFVIFMVVTYVNWFVYPFVSAKPNYADVEKVFNKLQIPPDWVEISRSENKGIAGRQCPIESDGCFSLSKDFKIRNDLDGAGLVEFMKSAGCISPTISQRAIAADDKNIGYDSECAVGMGRLISEYNPKKKELYVSARSR